MPTIERMPMSDTRIAELQALVDRANRQREREGGTTVVFGPAQLGETLGEIDALRARLAEAEMIIAKLIEITVLPDSTGYAVVSIDAVNQARAYQAKYARADAEHAQPSSGEGDEDTSR